MRVAEGVVANNLGSQRPDSASKELPFLHSVLANMPNMVFLKDAEHLRFVYMNKAGIDLIGIPAAELIGKNDYDFFPREQADFFVLKDREVLQSKQVVTVSEEPLATRNGMRILRTKKIAILNGNGDPEFLLGICEDITQDKEKDEMLRSVNRRLEELVEVRTKEIRKMNGELEAASRMKSLFLTSVSHELRTPLSVIQGYTSLMMDRAFPNPEKHLEVFSIIDRQCHHLRRVIDDIVDIRRVETNTLEIDKSFVDTEPLLANLCQVFSQQAARKGLSFQITGQEKLPRRLFTDGDRLNQILFNLIGNAIKYSDRGLITLKVDRGFNKIPREAFESFDVSFTVIDSGHGIPKQYHSEIFDLYSQGSTDHRARAQGVGLGLFLAKRLALLLGGDLVLLRSEPGQGSAFQLRLEQAC